MILWYNEEMKPLGQLKIVLDWSSVIINQASTFQIAILINKNPIKKRRAWGGRSYFCTNM